MTFNIGVNVVEIDGQAVPSIEPALTSVAGFIIKSKRGVADKVVRVTSWDGFVDSFGAHAPGAVGAYAIQGFFANGGTVAYVTRLLPSGTGSTAASAATKRFKGSVGSTAIPEMTVSAAYRGESDPGAWGNTIAVAFRKADDRNSRSTLVNLAVRYPAVDGREVEVWEGLDFSDADARQASRTRVNQGSRYIKIDFPAASSPPPADNITVDAFVTIGALGADGAYADSAALVNAATQALDRFDTQPIQLLACPETSDSGFVTQATARCAALGDRMFVGHLPLRSDGSLNLDDPGGDPSTDDDPTNLLALSAAVTGDKVYGALYGPNVLVLDPIGSAPIAIPPTGHVLGVYARTDRERNVWKAPAGDATRLAGVLGVSAQVTDQDHTYIVKQLHFNLARPVVGKGIVLDAARTLSTDSKWLFVNVRLLFNFVKTSLKNGLRWVVGEPNDDRLWGRIQFDSVRPFLMALWRGGAFGPGKPDQVFTIKVDASNNTPADIDQGIVNIEITFNPSRPAETIVVRVGQQPGASNVSET